MDTFLYLLTTLIFLVGCIGFCYFASVLTDRAFTWNDRRRERALAYRRRHARDLSRLDLLDRPQEDRWPHRS